MSEDVFWAVVATFVITSLIWANLWLMSSTLRAYDEASLLAKELNNE
jgi:hypothetical protein